MANLTRVALIQDGPVAFERQATVEKAVALIRQAARQQAELVVFPEAFISGYPKGMDFGTQVGRRSPEGREWFRRYCEGAIEVPGPETAKLADAAKKSRLHLVIGVIEREGGTLYCTVLFFGPDGALLGKHRKVMPTAMERLIWGFGDGSTLGVLPTPLGRLGAVICWENYMPLLRASMYAQGIELYCAPTVDDRDTWIPTMRHIALEGRCFVLATCQFARRGDYPADYTGLGTTGSSEVLIRGGSCVINPMGQLLAGPCYDQACILTAELDRDDLVRSRLDLDVVGHYARPDLFQLRVNTAVMKPVDFVKGDEDRSRPFPDFSRDQAIS